MPYVDLPGVHLWYNDTGGTGTPVVLNAGALTHTSLALGDACAALPGPLIEVHISNVFARESYRHASYVSAHADGVSVGPPAQDDTAP